MRHPLGGKADTVGQHGATNVRFSHVGNCRSLKRLRQRRLPEDHIKNTEAPATRQRDRDKSCSACIHLDARPDEVCNGDVKSSPRPYFPTHSDRVSREVKMGRVHVVAYLAVMALVLPPPALAQQG